LQNLLCLPVVQDAHAYAFRSYFGVAKETWRNLLHTICHPGQMMWRHITMVDRVVDIPMLVVQGTIVSNAGHYVWAQICIHFESLG